MHSTIQFETEIQKQKFGDDEQPFQAVNEYEAAEILGVSASLLRKLRYNGGGPKFCRFGNSKKAAIRYFLDDLDEFRKQNTFRTTSEFLEK